MIFGHFIFLFVIFICILNFLDIFNVEVKIRMFLVGIFSYSDAEFIIWLGSSSVSLIKLLFSHTVNQIQIQNCELSFDIPPPCGQNKSWYGGQIRFNSNRGKLQPRPIPVWNTVYRGKTGLVKPPENVSILIFISALSVTMFVK